MDAANDTRPTETTADTDAPNAELEASAPAGG